MLNEGSCQLQAPAALGFGQENLVPTGYTAGLEHFGKEKSTQLLRGIGWAARSQLLSNMVFFVSFL